MDIAPFLVSELDDTVARLRDQVIGIVPEPRRRERLPGGNSIAWATYHVARHASLALRVVGAEPIGPDPRLAGFDPEATAGGSGLQEVEQPWLADLETAYIERYALAVFADVRTFLATLDAERLDERPDVATALRAAGVDEEQFAWLYRMWAEQPIAFLVRWPLIGHVTNHVGEMIATRNQMGLSPFR